MVRAVDTCAECGNTDMHVRVVDGASVHECGLCGARFGERHAVRGLDDADDAAGHGAEAALWPLQRLLGELPGVHVHGARLMGSGRAMAARIDLLIPDAAGLVTLENLTKSLRLADGRLPCRCRITVEFEQCLVFVLRAEPAPDAAGSRSLAEGITAWTRQIERDRRLRWWRLPPTGPVR
jgi:hypothetical protein